MTSQTALKAGATALVLLLTGGYVALFHPQWVVSILAKLSPEIVYFANTEDPVVALTIDDGPDPATTATILDLLRQYDARATFFLITTRIPGNEDVVARIVQEDHEVANHLTTDEPSILVSPSDFERQLLESHDALSEFSSVRWFRPGSGWTSATMLAILKRHDYQCALGSVYPFDPQIPSSWFAVRYIIGNVRPGSIIVLHDYRARGRRTALALAEILPELDRRGFRVITLSELMDSHSPSE